MKNWKKIGQYFATGAALLASFASLFFASSEAHAFKLIRENGETGAVTRIEGLSVSLEGVETLYDVDFLGGSAVDVYGEDLMTVFADSQSAKAATRAVMDALGGLEYITSAEPLNSDGFLVGFSGLSGLDGRVGVVLDLSYAGNDDRIWEDKVFKHVEYGTGGGGRSALWKYAKFTSAAEVPTATTPEPNLIFGFITLGGLMLGSNARKTKV